MKVLIVGAGIAGNTLAFWLSKLGHNITVIERHTTLRASGLQIDIRGQAIDVMKMMGVDDSLRANAVKEKGIQFVDSSGRRRSWFPASNDPQSFTTEYELMRGDLVKILYDSTRSQAKFMFGTTVQSFQETDKSIDVQFTDGRMESFDLLVGADGQTSRTRKLMVGSETADGLHQLDDVIAYYSVSRPMEKDEDFLATMYVGRANRGMMVRRSKPDELLVYAGGKADDEHIRKVTPGDKEAMKAALRDIYKGGGWKTEELSEAAKDSKDFYYTRLGVVKLPSWFQGRVVLVGDAAYCPSPNTGMGTTSGILGAYILAGEIGKYCGRGNNTQVNAGEGLSEQLTTALRAYDQAFRPFMDHVQRGVIEGDIWKLPSSAIGIGLMHLLLGTLSAFRVDILGKMSIKSTPKDWKLPEYSF